MADFDACAQAGSMLGSGGIIVLDDAADMVDVADNIAHFYAHESCGQCTPCREGADWCMDILDRMMIGTGVQRISKRCCGSAGSPRAV